MAHCRACDKQLSLTEEVWYEDRQVWEDMCYKCIKIAKACAGLHDDNPDYFINEDGEAVMVWDDDHPSHDDDDAVSDTAYIEYVIKTKGE